jgi:prefoldin subunit 5
VQEAVLNLHKRKRACEITSADYTAQLQVYSDQLHDLETQQEALHTAATRYTEIKTWLDAFEESIESGDIFSATEGLIMKRLVDKIVVYGDGIEVRLKCGASATQEYVA